jgi:hypothetical protein
MSRFERTSLRVGIAVVGPEIVAINTRSAGLYRDSQISQHDGKTAGSTAAEFS